MDDSGDTVWMERSCTGKWVEYEKYKQALAEKDRESVKWSELIGSFTQSQRQYLVEMERLKQALAKKDGELELADFTIKECLQKLSQQDTAYQQLMEQVVRFAQIITDAKEATYGGAEEAHLVSSQYREAQAFLKERA